MPDLNTSGMVRTSVCELLPVPSTDVKVWTRGLEPTNGGTVCPSEVLPPTSTTGSVARVITPRLASLDQEPTNCGTVFPSEVLPSAITTGLAAGDIPPQLSPSAPAACAGELVRETLNTQPTSGSDLSTTMSTGLCTSKSLKGYSVRPTMKMLPTQPMFNISMEEMDMTASEHSCCTGGGYGTDPREDTYPWTLPQYLGFAQDGQTPVYKDKTKKSLYRAASTITTAEVTAAAEACAKGMKDRRLDTMESTPDHIVIAMPQASSLGPRYYGWRPQITEDKEDDMELDSHSEDEGTHHAVYITAGGKEGFGKEPDHMDGGHNYGAGGAPGVPIKVSTMAQMRARSAACDKKIDIRKHLAHEAIKNGHLILRKVPTTLQLADIMTKDVKQPRWGDVHGWAARQASDTLQ